MCLALAYMIGGAVGVALFVWQAFIAINILEITNYIEHYALTRKYLGNGRYEPVKPHHSWNTGLTPTNWFLSTYNAIPIIMSNPTNPILCCKRMTTLTHHNLNTAILLWDYRP